MQPVVVAVILPMLAVLTACAREDAPRCLYPDEGAQEVMVLFARATEVCVSGLRHKNEGIGH